MQDFLVGGVCLPKMPLKVAPYFQILFSHLLVRLTILSLHLTLHKHGRAIILSTSSIIIIMFHLLLYVTENVKQSHAVGGGRFWIEFQPGQGNLDHTCGNQVTHTTFPLSFQSVDPEHPPRLQSPTTLHPYVATKINPTSTKRVNDCSTHRSNQVLKLTYYHISRHVASTFKGLTKCATHHDLNNFVTTQTGNHKYHVHARGSYIFAECKSISTPIISRVAENYSIFTGPISHASSRDKPGEHHIGT